jgi:hypothetical protein
MRKVLLGKQCVLLVEKTKDTQSCTYKARKETFDYVIYNSRNESNA